MPQVVQNMALDFSSEKTTSPPPQELLLLRDRHTTGKLIDIGFKDNRG